MDDKNRLSISSLSFWGFGTPALTSNTACLRNILLQKWGIRTPFPPYIAYLGAVNEVNWENKLTADPSVSHFSREQSVSIVLTKDTLLTGRYDAVVHFKELPSPEVYEFKSMSSKTSFAKVFKKGVPKTENVAQICAYLSLLKLSTGQLIYSFYEKEKLILSKLFEIKIEEDGTIKIDGEKYLYTMHDLTEFIRNATHVLEHEEVVDRPEHWATSFDSPCYFCAWKDACAVYDSTSSKGLFLNTALLTMWRKSE